jgi:hypothetical protein
MQGAARVARGGSTFAGPWTPLGIRGTIGDVRPPLMNAELPDHLTGRVFSHNKTKGRNRGEYARGP